MDWLFRNLRGHMDDLLVAHPDRSALIAKDSEKDDPIDAGKSAQLLRRDPKVGNTTRYRRLFPALLFLSDGIGPRQALCRSHGSPFAVWRAGGMVGAVPIRSQEEQSMAEKSKILEVLGGKSAELLLHAAN